MGRGRVPHRLGCSDASLHCTNPRGGGGRPLMIHRALTPSRPSPIHLFLAHSFNLLTLTAAILSLVFPRFNRRQRPFLLHHSAQLFMSYLSHNGGSLCKHLHCDAAHRVKIPCFLSIDRVRGRASGRRHLRHQLAMRAADGLRFLSPRSPSPLPSLRRLHPRPTLQLLQHDPPLQEAAEQSRAGRR